MLNPSFRFISKTLMLVLFALLVSGISVVSAQNSSRMAMEKNQAVLRNIYDKVFNTGKIEMLDQYIASTLQEHDPSITSPGLQGVKQWYHSFHTAFPDAHFRVDNIITQGDWVVARVTVTGTQKGEYMGNPPTNKPFTMEVIDIVRIANGKIIEHWGEGDMLGMLHQLAWSGTPSLSAK
ncbi:MAG TPA: ester cyclase [bacterium]